MQHEAENSHDSFSPTPSATPHPPNPGRPRLRKLADAFLYIQTPWVSLAGLLVYVSYLLGWSPVITWIALALACLPFPLRIARNGIRSLRTPFDLPIFLFLAGTVIGLCVSDQRAISLGALQCILAVTLFYYSWVNSPRFADLIKVVIILLSLGFLVLLGFFLLDLLLKPTVVGSQPNFVIGGSGTHHGFAMYLAALAAILLGIAAFEKVKRTRLIASVLFLVFLAIIVAMTWESLGSLFVGRSVEGRREEIWKPTVELLRHSPITGLGLGCWAWARWGTTILGTDTVDGITHAHNAYLELYSSTGIVGALALLVAVAIGLKLSLDIVRSPRTHPWYGFGVGVILASVATLLVAILEGAPMGVPLVGEQTYYYVVSPIAWTLGGLLAIAHRQITKSPVS